MTENESTSCPHCGSSITFENRFCPKCGNSNNRFVEPAPKPDPYSYRKEDWYIKQQAEEKARTKKRFKIYGTLAAIFFVLLAFGLQKDKSHREVASENSGAVATVLDTSWIPSGFNIDQKLNNEVAFKVVPSTEKQICIWCSTSHGFYFWKIDFVSKNDCPDFYMLANIYSSTHALEKTWYQKGGYQSALKPFRLEVDSNDQGSTFELSQISCSGP